MLPAAELFLDRFQSVNTNAPTSNIQWEESGAYGARTRTLTAEISRQKNASAYGCTRENLEGKAFLAAASGEDSEVAIYKR